MGYYATLRDTNFRIRAENVDEASTFVNTLLKENSHIQREHFYRYVHGVEDMLQELGFETDTDTEVGLTIIGFSNKWRQQDELLDHIKGFVDEDTFIDFVGEDGALWRWTPTGTKNAIITWV
jgi:hypothetical protein